MLDVILLEDEPVLRHELGEFLESLGYAPQCVASLQEFDRHFDARRHRLAIIDIGLPDGNGLALIQRLRRASNWASSSSARSTAAPTASTAWRSAPTTTWAKAAISTSWKPPWPPWCGAWACSSARRRGCCSLAPAACSPRLAPVALSHQDLLVLHCLMGKAGASVSRRQIVQALGGDYLVYDQRRLDTQMRRLRRRCKRPAASSCLSRRCATAAIASICRVKCRPEEGPEGARSLRPGNHQTTERTQRTISPAGSAPETRAISRPS